MAIARKIGHVALAVVLSSLVLTAAAGAKNSNNSGGVNNGGNIPNCGAACDQSHNPTDYTKPCTPVPGNGCHTLPDTPCERGHGGTETGNKHCGPVIEIRKEQSTSPISGFTHDPLNAPLGFDFFYQITVTSLSNVQWTLDATDQVCDQSLDLQAQPLTPAGTQTLPAFGTVVYTCSVDAVQGAGITGDSIPLNAFPGQGPYPLTNTVTVTATPNDGSGAVLLTDAVTANFN